MGLKGNQGNLLSAVEQVFTEVDKNVLQSSTFDYYETEERGHGRSEIRRYLTTDAIDDLEPKNDWKGLNIIGLVESEREVKGKVAIEQRYYIGSIDNDAKRFSEAESLLLRQHQRLSADAAKPSSDTRAALERLIALYESWHAAEPDKGFDIKAAEYRAMLPAE